MLAAAALAACGAASAHPHGHCGCRASLSLALQLARWNWLFALEADGAPVALAAGEPRLDIEGEQLRVSVELKPQGGARVGAQWTLRCADPSWCWVADMPQPVKVQGCGAQQGPQAVRTAAAAGFQWRCGAGLSP